MRQSDPEQKDWKLEKGLLFYRNWLVVPDTDNIQTNIVREAHAQISTAHTGKKKTSKLVKLE